jgi:hypothetical protein
MVLNYKDSIKAEMSLSAMLGKNVNLSEVRAKLMSGDQAGGAAALKTALGGQDINAMNAFQKQALSQATGMGIQELMQLTQSKGNGKVKGSLEEKNALKTGKAIAQGALTQDIANAAAKLALDQKNRAEMLKFEQAKRMAMLFIEQKFRLNAIEREITYRKERESLGYTQAQENLKMGFMTDIASEQFMQVTSAFKDAEANGKISEAKLNSLISEFTSNQNVLQKAMAKGFITNDELPDIAYKIAMDASEGKSYDISKIAGVQRYTAASEKSNAQQNAYNEKRIAAFQNYGTVLNEARKTGDTDKLEELVEVMKRDYPKMYREFESQRDAGMKGGNAYNPENFIKYLRKISVSSPTPKSAVDAKGNPITVTADTKNGNKTTETTKGGGLKDNTVSQLSDSMAQTKLQVQMVKLLGVSAQFLNEINSNTAKSGTNIGGKLLNKAILDQASRTFAIAGVPQY